LGSPQVKKVTIHLAGDKKFIIGAKNFSKKTIYNDIRILNGNKISQPFVTYKEIMNGGNLIFIMTNQ
jgi:putative alpha-1,2-mannosidase